MLTVEQARQQILEFAQLFPSEEIPVEQAFGRVLAEDVYADRDYPPFNRSAMDGVSLRSEDLKNQREFLIEHEVFAGQDFQGKISKGACIKIMTGAAVPEGLDMVVRIEDCEVTNNKVKINTEKILPWTNISKKGEDCLAGKLLLKKGKPCNAPVIGLLAALGKAKVLVYKLPSVSILSTGDEVKNIHEEVLPFQIRDINSYSLKSFFSAYQIQTKPPVILKDHPEEIKKGIKQALSSDIIVLSGGVSMGDADFVPEILKGLGIKEVFHKVAIKPGKPLWFGTSGNKVLFALPGNPMSCQVAFKVFIEPYLRKCLGMDEVGNLFLPLYSFKKKKTKFAEYFPCRLINLNGQTLLEPVQLNGSGDITSTAYSDGIAIHPAAFGDMTEGMSVEFIGWG